MKKLRCAASLLFCLAAGFMLDFSAYAEEFTEEDRKIFGVFPLWGFLLLCAGVVMAAVIIIVEIFKRKMK